ncbi:SDR family NAD(P)-dependent oxidoreductase [Aquirufa sp. A-Brett2-W8]
MKKYIVTGAGQGIGHQIALQLMEEGHLVVVNDIDPSLLSGPYIKAGDVSSPQFIKELVAFAQTLPGELAGCVCNAGITTFGSFWDYSPESMKSLLDLNIQGTFFLIQEVAKAIRFEGNSGSIVVTSSVTGHQAHPDLAAYGMTKAALNQLVQNLVIDLSPVQIRINSVSPGATMTERTQKDANYLKEWSRLTPLGKPADVADIAEAVCFFLSDKAKHITGQTLIVDGGWTSVSPPPLA